VGIADRACFDLNAHAKAAKCDLMYRETLDQPVEVEMSVPTKAAGIAVMKAFGKKGRQIKEWMEALPQEELACLVQEVTKEQKAKRTVSLPDDEELECEFLPAHVVCETKKQKISTTSFMPGVVEPSFGIDRILFATLEHSYYQRPKDDSAEADKQTRGVLAFPSAIAPYKLTILPQDQRISREEKYQELLKVIRGKISALGHSCNVDDSGATLGKRYSRNDELGIPFACTVDFQSIQDGTVTLRERDSMAQIRLPAADVGPLLHDLCWGRKTWQGVQGSFEAVTH
jgi:glycyl-tRNA synthetase